MSWLSLRSSSSSTRRIAMRKSFDGPAPAAEGAPLGGRLSFPAPPPPGQTELGTRPGSRPPGIIKTEHGGVVVHPKGDRPHMILGGVGGDQLGRGYKAGALGERDNPAGD